MGEKFSTSAVTGTATVSVPIFTSQGRSGFGPELTLNYNSGSGNGPFGFGWNLTLPAVTRKTDLGLPEYLDGLDSDVFLLSDAEDLVPVFAQDQAGAWILSQGQPVIEEVARTVNGTGYTVRRYRPRTEGLFARIERWTRRSDGDVHWRSITKDNVLTLYGTSLDSRIADPEDPARVFSWLICETRDVNGNAVIYSYRREDGAGVVLARLHERNRGDSADQRRAANRYLKRVYYGNRVPLLDQQGKRPAFLTSADIQGAGWMFEVVFDYGEHDPAAPAPNDAGTWKFRSDPFSSYRAGFEVRTARLCRRVLMFHHFPNDPEVQANCLVRSTDFTYSADQNPTDVRNPVYTFLDQVTQAGYRRDNAGGYVARTLPPLEFTYSEPEVQQLVEEVDPAFLANLPAGVDGTAWQWIDLHGEGVPGVLSEQGGSWQYQRNLSPLGGHGVRLGPMESVTLQPNVSLTDSGAQFMDLAGDGLLDVVVLSGPTPGLYEHDEAEGWQSFQPFESRMTVDLGDPAVRMIDLDGDGRADALITQDEAFVWHASLGERGFGRARRMSPPLDEEKGPRVVFAEATQSIYMADLSGDGLTDIVRIRNGEVCYWPNLGHGRFGAKVAMDNAPHFDEPDQFDPARLRLADIDGSGTTDIIYLHRSGVHLYFNQSGNAWSKPTVLGVAPGVDELVSIQATDLLGNGTACLVWSSPLPRDAARPMRYVNLMGGQKPHLMIGTANNLGAETRIAYAPSTRYYLQDRQEGRPWITRLPFPVHVVERVVTYDHIARNRFVTRYAYHHGCFDAAEREFRGFGMVEQWDTEEIGALAGGVFPQAANEDQAARVPPIHTKTWFHTGAYEPRDRVSDYFAGLLDDSDRGEYYRAPGLSDAQGRALLLPDTVLPPGLTPEEEREACRALKGSMLRQEIFADDAPPGSSVVAVERAATPYTVAEQNFSVRLLQPRGGNQNAVFFTHPRETLTSHHERVASDPRVQHAMTLDVDPYGTVLREVAIAYGRRQPDNTLPLPADREHQARPLITWTEHRPTNAIDDLIQHPADYRTPMAAETSTWEITGIVPGNGAARFRFDEWVQNGFALVAAAGPIGYEQTADHVTPQKRLIERVRTLYRPDDCGASANQADALLPTGTLHPMARPGEEFQLAFTAELLASVFQRAGQTLLPNPAAVLGGGGPDRGGYRSSQELKAGGWFPASDPDGHWWIPGGRSFLSADGAHTAGQELAFARLHFGLPHRFRDPFGQTTVVTYDADNLLLVTTDDPLGNRVTVEHNDYRVLQPRRISDPNGNRTEVAFDGLGVVAGTAVMGKTAPVEGDSLAGFLADLPLGDVSTFHDAADPRPLAAALLKEASSRVFYDLHRFYRSRQMHPANPAKWVPVFVVTLARETHVSAPLPSQGLRITISVSTSDGFGREIQKKLQAEPGPLTPGGADVNPRWVTSGWVIFNNKGKPVRQYEPFFSNTHRFEYGVMAGVSPVLFYDPALRVVATLHPDHTYEKVVFGPWQQAVFDPNDTVAPRNNETGDPRTDPDIAGYVAGYFAGLAPAPQWQTWYQQRAGGALGPYEQAAATKAAAHADTPTVTCLDVLGRPFLTIAHNRVVCPQHDLDGTEPRFHTRVELDIEGNQREVRDAVAQAGDGLGRITMRYACDMVGNRIHQQSMDAGARWLLADAGGRPIRSWNSRGHAIRTVYDAGRRPVAKFVTGADPTSPNREIQTERLVYGEQALNATANNLRGSLHLHLDQAGSVRADRLDFKGNLVQITRRIATEYKSVVDWGGIDAVLPSNPQTGLDPATLQPALDLRLEPEEFVSTWTFDALNRPIRLTTPATSAMQPSMVRPGYNDAGLLERVDVNIRGDVSGGQAVWTAFVGNIDYDAKGQRQRIDYGNGTATTYVYDTRTYRLTHVVTRRNDAAFPEDCPEPPPNNWPGCRVQNLRYSYDPVGNVTRVSDQAQQTRFFRNRRVEPSCDYTYDALYRLIEATGREHLGLGGAPAAWSHDDVPRTGLAHPGDGNAMGRYVERYKFDAVGNLLTMQHRGSDPQHPGWDRVGTWNETSLTEDGTGGTLLKTGNRLSATTIGSSPAGPLAHDVHGNVIRMPHLAGTQPAPNLFWDYRDQLIRAEQGGGATDFYTYDAAGQRVRKVREAGAVTEERLYLGGFEIYRRRRNSEHLERETLHVMDDNRRIAVVEIRTRDTAGTDAAPGRQVRYQYGDHLGSAALELSDQAQIVSYEEYTPFGSTSYQAVRSQTDTPKRYRFTGKERDEGTGLYYHGRRYYVPWLARWLSTEPLWCQLEVRQEPGPHQSGTSATAIGSSPKAGGRPTRPPAPSESAPEPASEEGKGPYRVADDGTNPYTYVNNQPLTLTDPNGLSPVSVLVKQAAKVGVKKALKEFVENSIKSKIKDYVGKKVLSKAFAKQFAKDADDIINTLDSEWYEVALELVPVVGDVYGAASLGKKGKAAWDKLRHLENRLERLGQITKRWGEEGAKRIDDVIENRHRIRSASNAKETLIQAHHVVPIEVLKKNEVAQAAVVAGFDFNGKANTWLVKRGEHLAGHKELNELLEERLETWAKKNPGFTPDQAKQFLEAEVVPEWTKNFVEAVTH